jgi:hypothetical protein
MVVQPANSMAMRKVGEDAVVLKSLASANIKGYILQSTANYSFKKISALCPTESIRYNVWRNGVTVQDSGPNVDDKSLLK